jgi:hypothetical protein
VEYIAERSDALVAIFCVSGLLSLHAYHQTSKARWLMLLSIMFVGAVCSKEIGVVLALIAPIYWLFACVDDQPMLPLTESTGFMGVPGIIQYWLHEMKLVWQALVTRTNRKNWMLIIGLSVLMLIAYVAYHRMVLPTASIGASRPVSFVGTLLSIILSTFQGVPWEIDGWSRPFLFGALVIAFVLQPRSSAWRIIGFGFAWVVVAALPLAYVAAVEPRLFYVVEVGVAIMVAGLVMIVVDSLARIRMPQPLWRRGVAGLLGIMMLAFVGTTAISTINAQNEFQPGSKKMLQGDLIIWSHPATRILYPEHNLKMVEQHLRDAHLIDDTTP